MAKGAARNKKKVLLSFKSEQRRDAVLSLLRNSPEHRPWPFNEANTVHVDRQEALDSFRYVLCPEYVQMCYLHQQSPVDLAEMMENAPPYRDLGDLRRFHPFPLPVAATSVKTFLRYSLLELNRYPPIAVEGFTLGAPQIMDRIEFTTAWLVRTLDEEYTATRRRLAQFVRAHAIRDDRSTTPFWVPLYRTNGPYDDLVRVIGQSAMLDPDVQYSRPSRPRHMESFGYLESGLWYIDWDRLASLFQQSSQLNELLLAPPAHTASWEVPGFLGPLGLCDWEQRSFRKHQLPSFSSRVSTLTSAYRHFHPIYTSRSFLIPTPLDSLIITIFVLHHTLIIDSTLRGGRSTAIFLLGTFLKYLDVAVGKIAPLDPMANKSVPASSKANLKTYQGRLVRRNSTNGASDEEAPKTKVSKLPTRATKRKVIDSSSEEPTSSDADRALKTRTHKEVEPPPRRTIKHFAVMGASRNETYEALNVIENAPKKPKLLRRPAAERLAISKSSDGHTSSNDKELPKSGKSGPPGGKQAKSNYRIVGPKSSAIHSLRPYVRIPPRRIEPPKALSPQHHLSSPRYLSPPDIAGPELINLEIRPHSPVSDTPSTLLEEARRISDPRKILDDAQELAHRLHPSIRVARPGDFLNVWDADALDNILLALPDEGADPLDDYEYVDRTLNRVFQAVAGILRRQAGLNLEQFEIKILKLLKALRRCPLVPSGPSPMHTLDLAWPAAPTALVPKVPRVGMISASQMQRRGETSINGPQSDSDDGSSSDIDDDADCNWEDDETDANCADAPKPLREPYNGGPIPNDLRDSVATLCKAFNDALQALADKSNRPLHQLQRLANLSTVIPLRRSPNPFNGYARKRKMDRLPKLSQAELTDAYIKEKESFNGDSQALENWLDELRTVAKFMSRQKKYFKGEMGHMSKFDIHTIMIMVCGRPNAHAAHAQNAIICSSPEIESLIEGGFNLQKSLDELFVKVEAWGAHEKDGDDDVVLIIDQNNDTVYCVRDAGSAVDSMGESRAATEQPGVLPVLRGRSKRRNVSSKPSKGKGKAQAMPILRPGNFNSNPASTSGCATSSSYPDFRTAPNTNIGAGPLSSSAVVHLNTGSTSWHAAPLHSNFAAGSNGNIHASSSSAFNPHDFFVSDSDVAAMGSHLDNGTLQSNIGMFPSGINNFDTWLWALGTCTTQMDSNQEVPGTRIFNNSLQ
ncbi:hypothetical protein BS47DRAFT_1401227 [Hydnum rufescens UP504]|uniref:Uncharacterized protein n=1 Tax=Hydnum rufescens UP504 TaxID=1448309 RepID=A0A9P6AF70_9AGAM|nr:hypothetical protein BS47DRAFT_1401227 [Hydnum rufescens UP504]